MKTEIRILYLEDVAADALRAENQLRKSGLVFQSHRVESREAFLSQLEPPPDIILSDHGLPSFDGFMALGLAREKCPDVPFIFVTNALTREMEIEKLTSGVTDYVLKSELNYLPYAVHQALHKAEAQRSQRQRLNELYALPPQSRIESRPLPICSSCKKIRDEQDQWKTPEVFFNEHLNIHFTHGVCPECTHKFFEKPASKAVEGL